MSSLTPSVSPLRQRMIDDMRMRKLEGKTQAYGAGLRASEVVSLKVTDVDSERMTLRVEQGNGRKDRYAMLSPILLERLRAWWRLGHAQGKILPNGWLFPGLDPTLPKQHYVMS